MLFSLLLLLAGHGSYGQQQQPAKTITGNFEQVPFRQFVRELEIQTDYRFYFEAGTPPDSFRVSVRVSEQPLKRVLEQVFDGTPYRFALTNDYRVFLTTGTSIEPQLSTTFFRPTGSPPEGPVVAAPEDLTPTTAPGRSRYVSAAEYKVYQIGTGNGTGLVTLAGHIKDIKSGEPVIGATIYSEAPSIGTNTDQFGFYSLTLPAGRYTLQVRSVGSKNTRRQVILRGNGRLEIEVEEDITTLREVVIEGEKDKNVSSTQMGLEKLDIKTIKQVPTAFGEADILRVILTLPGVKSVGEGSTGLNVRGGATDQNLILFNDMTVYNPSHLFGFFSAFNPDMLQGVELYKSAMPAKYGGRLSSVLDITTREGNKKQFGATGGIGPLTSRLTLEGPIIKDRSSFLIGGRASYSDWLLRQLDDKKFRQSSAAFSDLSAHISHQINDQNSVYATGYFSTDRFKLASDTTYRYANKSASLKWRHNFSNQLYGVLTGAFSQYDYDITSENNDVNSSRLQYAINQTSLRADFSYYPNPKHSVDFGASSLLYNVSPGGLTPLNENSLVLPNVLAREQALESAVYVSDKIDVNQRLSVSVGLRYSLYNALGPRSVYEYAAGESRSESTIIDTVRYGSGKVLATYHGPEYRVSARYSLSDNSSVKLSYNRTRQYISQLTNTASVSPADTWKLADNNIRPQIGDQVSAGYYRNFKSNTIETSVEVYYKSLRDFVDYKGGAVLLLNPTIETDIINAEGKAYGVEVLVRKLTGKMNGWLSYTYSRSLVRANVGTPADQINDGRYYPSNFDKPHDVTLVGNYRFSRRFSTSLNFTYSTGRPITLPIAKYLVGNTLRVLYSDRNAYRVPDYLRADLALNIEGGHKAQKLAHSSWTVGVYNLTGRQNPYSIYFKSENGQIRGYKLSIFGRPIPTITYNFKF
nr:TonB-dependent receptor [Hymenobacter terrestris]